MKTHFLALVPFTYYTCISFDIVKCIQIGTVLLTSINYWRNPCKGFRRNMDIVAVFSTGFYNVCVFPRIWIPTVIVCFCIWRLSNKLHDRRIHSLIHVIGCSVYFKTSSL